MDLLRFRQATSSPNPVSSSRKRTKVKNNLKLAIINCQSIKNKTPEFETFIESTDQDIVLGTESWLKPEILNSEIFPPQYNVFRKDRKNTNKKTGGGVFILVRKEYTCTELHLDSNCELIMVELQLKDQQNIKLGCFYRPPWSDDTYLEELAKNIDQVDPNRKANLWIGGDFNLPLIDWDNETPQPGNNQTKISNILLNSMNDHSLSQVVKSATSKNNILDLFFTTNPILVNRVVTAPPLSENADHDIVFVDINTIAYTTKQKQTTRLVYSKANWEGMRENSQHTRYQKPASRNNGTTSN